jgi:hypothetical protein
MSRIIARAKARELTDNEIAMVSGGTTSVVRSGNPLVVESTDPGDQGGGGPPGDNGGIDP